MRVGKTREMLIEEVKSFIPVLIQDKKQMDEVAAHLSQYNMTMGDVMAFINNKDALMKAPIQEVTLFAEQVMIKCTNNYEWIDEWLTKQDVKNLRTYKKINPLDEKISLPLELDTVIPFGSSNKYMAIVPLKLIGQMYNSGLLHYNPELQREAKRVKQGDSFALAMNLQPKNVEEITKQALEGDLYETTLYYNCQPLTGEDEIEMSYNKKTRKLTIHKDTIIDLLDGAHRTVGIYNAYATNPELDGEIAICFSNLTIEQAKRFQVDHAKSTPISKGRISELAGLRRADEVVKELKVSGELKNRITSSESIKYSLGELVSYSTLSNAIDKYFTMKSRFAAITVAKDINEYMMYLFDYYPDDVNSDSLMFKNKMFVGHIYLASKMKNEGVPYSDLKNYLDNVDFSRNADVWKEYNVIVGTSIAGQSEKGIVEVFEKIIWGRPTLCQS